MTAAGRYRRLEISPSVQVARWIFNNRLNNSPKIPLREVVEDIKTGKTPSKNEKKYYENGVLNWFKPSEIGEGKYLTNAKDKLSKLAVDNKQATIYRPGTLLITAIGDIGRLAITKDIASSNQQITGIAFNKLVLPEYAYYYFLAFRSFFYTDVSQTTLPIVNQKKITSIPFILCSVKEQKATTDFLSAIELITLPADVEQLDSLTSDSELLEVAKGIFAIHFASATLVAEFDNQELHLTQLRQALLREAMQGQLLPQDPTDEPAALLLKKLQAAKVATGKGGKGKAGALFAEEADAEEGPFEIPANWAWGKGSDVADFVDPQPSHRTPPVSRDGVPYVSMGDISDSGIIDFAGARQVGNEILEEHKNRYTLREGDFIFGKIGTLGKPVFLPEPYNYTLSANLILIQVHENIMLPKYLYWFLSSSIAEEHVLEKRSTMSYPVFGMKKAREMPVPLPPIAEQHRIVAKLEQLLQHCDALEQRIRESRHLAEQLLQTALREALAPPAGTEPTEEAEPELAEADAAPAPARRGRPRQPRFSLDNPPPDLFDF